MQKGQVLIFLLVGILVVVVAGGTFYLGKLTTPEPSPKPVVTYQTTLPTSLPSSATDETANWKTYTNAKYGYSFKYPPNLTSIELSPDKGETEVGIVAKPEESTDEGYYMGLLKISSFISESTLYDSDEIAKELLSLKVGDQYKPPDRIVGSLTRTYPTYKRLADITVGEVQAKIFENPKTLHGGIERRFYLNRGNDIFLITSEYLPSQAEYYPQELYDNILSTFKFL